MDNNKRNEFYERLTVKLNEHHEFPSVYMFKFIVPSDNSTIARVEALFGPEAQVVIRQSSKGNFVSVSARELMLDAESIVAVYRKAEAIEGIISL